MKERESWLGFAIFSGIGPGKFNKLLTHFGSAKSAWEASLEQLQKVKIGENVVREFIDFRQKFDPQQYEDALAKANVGYVLVTDEAYPALLKQIKNPPFVLFYKGNVEILRANEVNRETSGSRFHSNNIPTIGIVGTRKITEYGKQVTENITADLVINGYIVVSGLALGVDALAHQTTLDNGGKTIAVLGCGVDCPNPQENAQLYAQILENSGLIVSEYGLGVQPTKGSFLSRNRIIAGLSQGVVVTEGASQSGSLTTAHHAFINGRKVFAVPGPIYSQLSAGPYQLIEQGATLVTSAKDIMQALGQTDYREVKKVAGEKRIIKGETSEEQILLDLLAAEELAFDELVKRSQLPASTVGMLLSLLEMRGTIYNKGDGSFALKE